MATMPGKSEFPTYSDPNGGGGFFMVMHPMGSQSDKTSPNRSTNPSFKGTIYTHLAISGHEIKPFELYLVGGFNPSEKY